MQQTTNADWCNACGQTGHLVDKCPSLNRETPEFRDLFFKVEQELKNMRLKHKPITPYVILKAVQKVTDALSKS